MKKILSFVLSTIIILMISCSHIDKTKTTSKNSSATPAITNGSEVKDTDETKILTLDDVINLSKKGNELTWKDFKDYKGEDIGSGIFIFQYKLEDNYILHVCGVPPEKPNRIYLYHQDKKNGIDIRTSDIKKFLETNSHITSY